MEKNEMRRRGNRASEIRVDDRNTQKVHSLWEMNIREIERDFHLHENQISIAARGKKRRQNTHLKGLNQNLPIV